MIKLDNLIYHNNALSYDVRRSKLNICDSLVTGVWLLRRQNTWVQGHEKF